MVEEKLTSDGSGAAIGPARVTYIQVEGVAHQ